MVTNENKIIILICWMLMRLRRPPAAWLPVYVIMTAILIRYNVSNMASAGQPRDVAALLIPRTNIILDPQSSCSIIIFFVCLIENDMTI